MAKNINVSRPNGHHLIIGTSGSGKSSYLRSSASPLRAYQRQIFWDVDEDYTATRYRKKSDFARALARVANSNKFKIAFTPNDVTTADFDFFCKCVWELADGNKPTAIIIEELADVTSAGKARAPAGILMRRGRKYGLDVFAVSQRPAEIDKTTYSQCANRWCGFLDGEIELKRMAALMNVSAAQLKALKKLEYFYKKDGEQTPKKSKVIIRR